MTILPRYAILLDGGFVIKKLGKRLKRFPTAEDIDSLCQDMKRNTLLQQMELLRIYFYHARPAKDELKNPIDGKVVKLAATKAHANHDNLLNALELRPDFAVRLGETVAYNKWSLTSLAIEDLMKTPRLLNPDDLTPNISQKGVDLRIGLDIARLSLREMVHVIIVVTGDSDLIPAFKFARREGVRVYLAALDHGVRRELKVHADRIL